MKANFNFITKFFISFFKINPDSVKVISSMAWVPVMNAPNAITGTEWG